MYSKELLKLALKNGWRKDRQKGAHIILKKDGKTVSLPFHNKELGKGICHKLLKELNIKTE